MKNQTLTKDFAEFFKQPYSKKGSIMYSSFKEH